MLRDLAENSHGYPDDLTPEEWADKLKGIAALIERGADINDNLFPRFYADRFHEASHRLHKVKVDDDGFEYAADIEDLTYDDLWCKHRDEEREIAQIKHDCIVKGFQELADRWEDLWD